MSWRHAGLLLALVGCAPGPTPSAIPPVAPVVAPPGSGIATPSAATPTEVDALERELEEGLESKANPGAVAPPPRPSGRPESTPLNDRR